jgi:hypothetical protein
MRNQSVIGRDVVGGLTGGNKLVQVLLSSYFIALACEYRNRGKVFQGRAEQVTLSLS